MQLAQQCRNAFGPRCWEDNPTGGGIQNNLLSEWLDTHLLRLVLIGSQHTALYEWAVIDLLTASRQGRFYHSSRKRMKHGKKRKKSRFLDFEKNVKNVKKRKSNKI